LDGRGGPTRRVGAGGFNPGQAGVDESGGEGGAGGGGGGVETGETVTRVQNVPTVDRKRR